MRGVRVSRILLATGLAAGVLAGEAASAATGEAEEPQVAAARDINQVADLILKFIQVDGPESGHVRVVLTPETRPLTIIEARMAAQQGFLEALKEPGLGDDLKRVTVVVRLMPASHPDPSAAEQVIVYQHKGGRDWSVFAGE